MESVIAHSETTRGAMATAHFDCVARVQDSDRAVDLAVPLAPARLTVIRCVESATPEDHTALATMISEGDFIWASLVCGERDGPEIDSLVETFHVSELDRLVARLQELREAFGEAG